jgi:hypothetical protein
MNKNMPALRPGRDDDGHGQEHDFLPLLGKVPLRPETHVE